MVFLFNKHDSPATKDAFCHVWYKLAQWFWRKLFLNIWIEIYYFAIISPWMKLWPYIWTKLNPFYPRMLCAMFSWNLPSGSGDLRKSFKILNRNLLFRYYLPSKKDVALHLNKLKSTLPKDALCQVWLKLAQWFWRRRFLNILNRNLLFRYYLPLEKGVALHLNKLECLLPKDAWCQVWLKLAQWFWRRSRK